MIMLVMVVTIMFIVLMTRYNLAGWTQLLKCASPIFHPQHQVINMLVCGIVFSLEFAIGYLVFESVYLVFLNVYLVIWSVSLVFKDCFWYLGVCFGYFRLYIRYLGFGKVYQVV